MRSVLEHLFIIYQWVLKENSYLTLRFSLISGLFITLQHRLEWASFDVLMFRFIIVVLYMGGIYRCIISPHITFSSHDWHLHS